MTIGFKEHLRRDGTIEYSAFNCSLEAGYAEVLRAVDTIEATGNSHFSFPAEKLPIVVAALRLSGFEVK